MKSKFNLIPRLFSIFEKQKTNSIEVLDPIEVLPSEEEVKTTPIPSFFISESKVL